MSSKPFDEEESEDTTYEWPNYCTACGSFWYNCVCEEIAEQEGDDA